MVCILRQIAASEETAGPGSANPATARQHFPFAKARRIHIVAGLTICAGKSQLMTEGAGHDGAGLSPSGANRLPSSPLARLSLAGQFLRYLLCAGVAALVNFLAGTLFVDG
jgi:hypothetical protein